MKSEDLLRHIGSVDEKYIEEVMSELPRSARRRSGPRGMLASIAASLAVVILGASVMAANGAQVPTGEMTLTNVTRSVEMAKNSVIMLDVNPSIRLEVNDRGTVVKTEGLNDESKAVLEGLELDGKSYTDAVKDVVVSLEEHDYITDLKNSVLVSVAAQNDELAGEILKASVESVAKLNDTVDYGMSILSQIVTLSADAAQTGEKYGVSEGRVDLVNKFISGHSDYSFDKLIENNVQLLNQLFEYVGLPEGVERLGDVAGVVPRDCEAKLNLDELSCDEIVSFASAISDFYDKLSEYYTADAVAKRIGYVFSIAESSNADGQKLWTVFAESLTKNIGDHGAIINIGQNKISDWFNHSEIGKAVTHIAGQLAAAA